MYEAKKRPGRRPLPVAVADLDDMGRLVKLNDAARALAQRFLPGPLLLVLPAKPGLPDVLLGGGGSLGVTVPAQPAARALARSFGPLTATTAAREGDAAPQTLRDARAAAGGAARAFLDAGVLVGGRPTVVDATGPRAKVIREGTISAAELGLHGP